MLLLNCFLKNQLIRPYSLQFLYVLCKNLPDVVIQAHFEDDLLFETIWQIAVEDECYASRVFSIAVISLLCAYGSFRQQILDLGFSSILLTRLTSLIIYFSLQTSKTNSSVHTTAVLPLLHSSLSSSVSSTKSAASQPLLPPLPSERELESLEFLCCTVGLRALCSSAASISSLWKLGSVAARLSRSVATVSWTRVSFVKLMSDKRKDMQTSKGSMKAFSNTADKLLASENANLSSSAEREKQILNEEAQHSLSSLTPTSLPNIAIGNNNTIIELSFTEKFTELFSELEDCSEEELKQKIVEMNEMMELMDKEEFKSVFTIELFDKMHKMIEEEKISLENSIVLLKCVG
ncbi:uncharacterized protein MONOS_13695 [Monocercomonoides exilis]|uniref:uncharacterized protein n=1 Tax=Monocercomonoides exilis TaxID=2049356 RepID=UPI00355A0A5F|nr:hypothetical protein MONOS_13695 [Monocercomonoides exilis]|eukprot:MONOS_13695.1-p1 / transcript=MONOS_13695.1 / gene=MONOS_13695 / organism=Monocercomonoides_exilis_PA203 / gene_product=unspecified product / transcript_product=unspecified product / location=Mono_scaffold00866:6619-8288(+) / protein_length=349 / sequence_SO=supercontig / SO=protein_coding / is_pseudo=false